MITTKALNKELKFMKRRNEKSRVDVLAVENCKITSAHFKIFLIRG